MFWEPSVDPAIYPDLGTVDGARKMPKAVDLFGIRRRVPFKRCIKNLTKSMTMKVNSTASYYDFI